MADPKTITLLVGFLRERPRKLKEIMDHFNVTKITVRRWLHVVAARGHKVNYETAPVEGKRPRGRPIHLYTLEY